MTRSLDELRSELAQLDRDLLEGVARRQQLSQEIGAAKRASGRSTRDFNQEREVIERARANAGALGLAPDIAEELVLLLIRSSLTVQEKELVVARAGGSGKRVLVIGGAGKMGRWFARFLSSQGFDVEIADPIGSVEGFAHVSDWKRCTLDHDIIVVAAQLRVSNEILCELALNPPPSVIFDIGSLKSPLREGLNRAARAGAKITSIHPMFGPSTELLSGRHVVFVDLGVPEATQVAKDLFAGTMAVHVDMDLESHDRLIAYVLGLSHALNLAFATALAESGEAAPKLANLSSTTFDAQLAIARAVASENPHLYYEIQSLNDYGTESLSALLYAVERLRSVVRAGDEQGFCALMDRCHGYLIRDRAKRQSNP